MSAPTIILDPLFDAEQDADAMLALCERFDGYRQYLSEQSEIDYGGQFQRFDSAANYIRTGGRLARNDADPKELAARTSYFRESYAYGDTVYAPGIERFWHHPAFIDAARTIHGRDVVVPAIAYANVMLPGQELAIHTDVPEFRGANRKRFPQWLMVVMHHSRLFDAWRMPIATGIAYFGHGTGGALAYWPDGADGAVRLHATAHNTAIVLDTDSVFHGVDRVGGDDATVARVRPDSVVIWHGDAWELRDGAGGVVARYEWDEIRFSVSWKAYCFSDNSERDLWHTHRDDLELDTILDRLFADLVAREVVDQRPDDEGACARLLVDNYIRFPATSPAAR